MDLVVDSVKWAGEHDVFKGSWITFTTSSQIPDLHLLFQIFQKQSCQVLQYWNIYSLSNCCLPSNAYQLLNNYYNQIIYVAL